MKAFTVGLILGPVGVLIGLFVGGMKCAEEVAAVKAQKPDVIIANRECWRGRCEPRLVEARNGVPVYLPVKYLEGWRNAR